MRLPPDFEPNQALEIMKNKLTSDVPYNAQVSVLKQSAGPGWCMKEPKPWLSE